MRSILNSSKIPTKIYCFCATCYGCNITEVCSNCKDTRQDPVPLTEILGLKFCGIIYHNIEESKLGEIRSE